MKKEDVVIGGLYFVKDRSSFYEIQTEVDNSGQVEGLFYTGNKKPIKMVMKISELAPIAITEELLLLLSFIEVDGNLEGLPNEHYFELKTHDEPIRMKIENGCFCFVQPKGNAVFGCRFEQMPYFHQLQVLLAPFCPIDIKIIIKNYATPTT